MHKEHRVLFLVPLLSCIAYVAYQKILDVCEGKCHNGFKLTFMILVAIPG